MGNQRVRPRCRPYADCRTSEGHAEEQKKPCKSGVVGSKGKKVGTVGESPTATNTGREWAVHDDKGG